MSNNNLYYTASEAQARLGFSKATFFRKVNQGLILKAIMPRMMQRMYLKQDDEKFFFSHSSKVDLVEETCIALRCFGRDFITQLPERISFQHKSEFTFHSLKVDGQVIGYICMFHLPDMMLDDLLSTNILLSRNSIVPFQLDFS